MSQITINIGTAANDGTGDPLRTAFNDVNLNFNEVYAAGPVGSNIQIANNRILTTNTNGNLILSPNGIAKVVSNVDIVPNSANTHSLGASTQRWNTVYGQYLNFTKDVTIGGNVAITGNLTAGNIQYTGNVFVGDLEGSVFDGASSVVLDVIDSSIYVDNYYYANGTPVTFGSNYANANAVAYGQAGWAGNIIPATSNVYSLGNSTNQWNDLYLSNATIYMNNVPIGLTAGNVLTVNGDNVVTATAGGNIDVNNIVSDSNVAIDTSAEQVTISVNLSDWVFDETGVLTAPGEIETVGNITGGNLSTTGNVTGGNLIGNVYRNGNVKISADTSNWTFDNTGVLTLPADGGIRGTTGLYSLSLSQIGGCVFVSSTNTDYSRSTQIALAYESGVTITADTGTPQAWIFSPTGNLTAPGNITTTGNISVGNILAQNIRTINGTVYLGQGAGLTNQGLYGIAVGRFAGSVDQGAAGLAIGQLAGSNTQGQTAIALGLYAGANTQSANAVAIGTYAGQTTQGTGAVAIGREAGNSSQGVFAVAVGWLAGNASQGGYSVSIGPNAGSNTQGENSVAIGVSAAREAQGSAAIAIGQGSGVISQGAHGIAIGDQAGQQSQAANAIAIGTYAGYESAGVSSISIGTGAGYYIANNSIVINATGANLDGNTANAVYIAPVRNDVSNIGQVMFYNTTSKEVTYGNTISVSGNISSGNISVTGNISGNTAGYAIGYRDIPQVTFSANATAALADAGKHFYSTTAGNLALTLPDNSNVAYPTGATLTVVVNSAGNVLVNQGTGVTLYMAGSSTTGNRVVGAYGLASVMKVAANTWVISGTGVY